MVTILANWDKKNLQPVGIITQRKNRGVKCEPTCGSQPEEDERWAALLNTEGLPCTFGFKVRFLDTDPLWMVENTTSF